MFGSVHPVQNNPGFGLIKGIELDKIRSDLVRSGQTRSRQIWSDQVRSGQVRPGQIRADQVRAGRCATFGMTLGSLWADVWTTLESMWDEFGITLG